MHIALVLFKVVPLLQYCIGARFIFFVFMQNANKHVELSVSWRFITEYSN